MVYPEYYQQDQTTNLNPEQPLFTRYQNDPHLIAAREMFQQSRAAIVGPPPRPKKLSPAQSQASLAAFTERTVYAQLLEGHQNEILRLEEELKAEKMRSAALKTRLVKAEEALLAAQKVAGPGNKRRKLGGKLF